MDQTKQRPSHSFGKWLSLAALLVVASPIVVQMVRGQYSASVDVAHHYALVNWLTNYWGVLTGSNPILGEMAFYPDYSHILAALVGMLIGSPLLGMQIVGAASVALTLATLAWTPRLMSQAASWVFTIVLVLLLIVNNYTLRLDLFGHELAPNYFFSQMAAQACYMVMVLGAIRFEQQYGAGAAITTGILCFSLLLAGVHLLPAIEGLAYGLLLLTLHALSSRKKLVMRLAVLGALLALSGLGLYLHPAFSAMRRISENDGVLPLNSISSSISLLILALVSLLVSSALMILGRMSASLRADCRNATICRHMGCAGVGIAILCLLQFAALKLGYGSEYACRKYAFGLSTFLIINVSLLLTWVLVRRFVRPSETGLIARLNWIQPSIVLTAFFLLTVLPSVKLADTVSMLEVEHTALFIKKSGILEGAKHSYARGLGLGVMSNVDESLVSNGIFESPRDANGDAVLENKNFPEPTNVGFILASTKGQTTWSNASCIRMRYPDSLVLTDGQCILAKFTNQCSQDMDLSDQGFLLNTTLTGFSHPESSGRWSDATLARFHCEYPKGFITPTKVLLKVVPYSPADHVQTLDVSVNGISVGHFKLTQSQLLELDLTTAITANKSGLSFEFSIPNAVSPRDLGISDDRRKLGIWISSIHLH